MNVCSAQHYDVDQAILADFEESTGVKVNLIEGMAAELLVCLEREVNDLVAQEPVDAEVFADITLNLSPKPHSN